MEAGGEVSLQQLEIRRRRGNISFILIEPARTFGGTQGNLGPEKGEKSGGKQKRITERQKQYGPVTSKRGHTGPECSGRKERENGGSDGISRTSHRKGKSNRRKEKFDTSRLDRENSTSGRGGKRALENRQGIGGGGHGYM